ncbi:MAG TPA: hypothetical protein DCQ24_02315 [Bacteroidales bacterium]|nr:hypothetical protein [Bacteroidales bacterium]
MNRFLLFILMVFLAGFFLQGRHIGKKSNPDNRIDIPDNRISSWNKKLTDSCGIPEEAVHQALNNFSELKEKKIIQNDSLLTIIDYSRSSTEKRLFILDIKNEQVVKNTLVAHGMNSGIQNAENFSNDLHSNKSSLGLFLTQDCYNGKHGYSLRIKGMNEGINDNAYKRAVVIHGADYVSEQFILKYGRIGRSFGCPALPLEETREIIDLIKNGSCLYIYHPVLDSITQPDLKR